MKKALAIMSQSTELQPLHAELEALRKEFKERQAFIKKQVENLFNDSNTRKMEVWDRIASVSKDLNLLPQDFSREKYHFHIEHGVLLICDEKEGATFEDFLRHVLGGSDD